MADLTRPQLALCALGAVVIVLLGARHLGRDESGEPAAPVATPAPLRIESADRQRVVVHVAGAVRRPGIYRLTAASRVDDAVRLAGGPTRRADLDGLNLAAQVEDGRQVIVPERAPPGGAAPTAASSAGVVAAGATGAAPMQPVNLNTASLAELDVLPGIGPAMAQRILDHREANGGFSSVEELADVPGIGDVRMASLRELVVV